MAYKEDLDIGKIALISLVSVLLTVALVLFLQVLFYGFKQGQLASPRYSQVPAEMTKYVADQQGKLASYEVVDRERKVVTMPIDLAMQMVVVELDSDPQAHVTGVLDPVDVVEPPPDQPSTDGDDGETPAADVAKPAADTDETAADSDDKDSTKAPTGPEDEADPETDPTDEGVESAEAAPVNGTEATPANPDGGVPAEQANDADSDVSGDGPADAAEDASGDTPAGESDERAEDVSDGEV